MAVKLSAETHPLDHVKAPALALLEFEGEKPSPGLHALDQKLGGEYTRAVSAGEFKAKVGELFAARSNSRFAADKLLVFGAGKRDAYTLDALYDYAARAARAAQERQCEQAAVAVLVPAGATASQAGRAAALAASLGLYAFEKYLTDEERKKKPKCSSVRFVVEPAALNGFETGMWEGERLALATNFAREIGNEPANIASPEWVAVQAQRVAKENGLASKVWGKKELEAHAYGALLSVSSGSAREPRLVTLEYVVDKKVPWVAIVGKGITFDSGGISIKPSADMDKMKYDKSGACAVLGAMSALKQLGVKVNVVGIMALTDNMPSGSASKPGDIVKSASGKTIEVLNTDAEGRMVLADAIHHALQYKPKAIIDAATLTGACTVALGDYAAGLLSNNAELTAQVKAGASDVFERVWELPLAKDHDELIKGTFGDVKNIAPPDSGAGASTGAAFIKQFVGDTPWVHLDIAGTAWVSKPKPVLSLGQTGAATRIFLGYLMELNASRK